MKKLVLLCLLLLTASGCEAGRRFYYAASGQAVRVPTEAMMPTIKPGGHAVIDREYYANHPVSRFDMVVIKDPTGGQMSDGQRDMFFIKRVVGMGGEMVEIRDGSVLVNGDVLSEPFRTVPLDRREKFGPYKIPEGEFFLLGDNRQNSADSRYWPKPTIDKSYIVAKVTEVLDQ